MLHTEEVNDWWLALGGGGRPVVRAWRRSMTDSAALRAGRRPVTLRSEQVDDQQHVLGG
jgi:hypothetical protein